MQKRLFLEVGIGLFLGAVALVTVNGLECPKEYMSNDCNEYLRGAPATEALISACKEVPFASGCQISFFCGQSIESDVCFPGNHLLSICRENPSLSECKDFVQKCGPLEGLPLCEGIVDFIPPTSEVEKSLTAICQRMDSEECGGCVAQDSEMNEHHHCTDYLDRLGKICTVHEMEECAVLSEFCSTSGANSIVSFCPTPMEDHSSHGHHHDGSTSDAALLNQDDSCVSDPSDPKCSGYEYPLDAINSDIDHLCSPEMGMPFMIGCSIRASCAEKKSDSDFCHPFTLLATLCHDMPGMKGCVSYNSLCGDGSVVQQCRHHTPIPGAPETMASQESILEGCSSHAMPGCDQCTGHGVSCPTTLQTMSEICSIMPSMSFCNMLERFCTATNGAFDSFCDLSSSRYLPPMRMYFHFGLREIILFKDWIPESRLGYAGSFLVIVIFGLIVQAIRAGRLLLEDKWLRRLNRDEFLRNDRRQILMRNAIRAFLTGATLTIEYLLMLIVMTFNVGLIIAVVLGVSLGMLLFGHLPEKVQLSLGRFSTISEAEKGGCCS